MATAPEGEGWRSLLAFWFGSEPGASRREWFRKDPEFDRRLRERFGALQASAANRELDAWRASPEPMLALVIALDQLSRNLFRDDARAFAQDEHARDCAAEALERGDDLGLLPVQRMFLYLPFEHSEDLRDQERSIELFRSLEAFDATRGLSDWARRHHAIVARFGRFPHRNAALGREPTPEEVEFLKTPGSGF